MSEGPSAGIDPRFDPRFQRGYVPDAAATPQATDAAAQPVVASPRHDDIAAIAAPAVPAAPAEPAAPAAVAPDQPVDPVPSVVADPEPALGGSPQGVAAAAASDDRLPAEADDDDAFAGAERLTPTRWMWIALGACVVFVVVGALAFWVQASDPSNYIGGVRAGIDETFRLIVNTLAPALVQAGLIGIVVVLVTWAVRGRAGRTPEDRP